MNRFDPIKNDFHHKSYSGKFAYKFIFRTVFSINKLFGEVTSSEESRIFFQDLNRILESSQLKVIVYEFNDFMDFYKLISTIFKQNNCFSLCSHIGIL